MSVVFRSWLPQNTTAPALAQDALTDMVDGWSTMWFKADPPRVAGALARITGSRKESRGIVWQVCDAGFAIGMSQSGSVVLGLDILGVQTTDNERPSADLRLLERVGCDCLTDLKHRAAALFEAGKMAAWRDNEAEPFDDPSYRVMIANGVGNMLAVKLSAECFARFVKAKLPSAPPHGAFGATEDALATLPIALSVAVGRCALTLAELGDLAEGDVLVLDRPLDAPMPLAVGGVAADRGACMLSEREDRISLQITEALVA